MFPGTILSISFVPIKRLTKLFGVINNLRGCGIAWKMVQIAKIQLINMIPA